MRAFVAIDVPPLTGATPAELRPEGHVTLHFFQELPADRVAPVVEAMRVAAAGSVPFVLGIRGVGAFPSLHRPRIVWAGVGEGSTAIQALTTRLREALTSRGFPAEGRPFVPHLTLRRLRSPREAAWAHRFLIDPANADREWTRATVSEILLKESELLPTGARHATRERVRLGVPSPAPRLP
jgi:RNA 2',3'-cyclic 3'-phosphodiesterase